MELTLALPHGEALRLARPALALWEGESDNAAEGLGDPPPVAHAVAPPLSDGEELLVAGSKESVGAEEAKPEALPQPVAVAEDVADGREESLALAHAKALTIDSRLRRGLTEAEAEIGGGADSRVLREVEGDGVPVLLREGEALAERVAAAERCAAALSTALVVAVVEGVAPKEALGNGDKGGVADVSGVALPLAEVVSLSGVTLALTLPSAVRVAAPGVPLLPALALAVAHPEREKTAVLVTLPLKEEYGEILWSELAVALPDDEPPAAANETLGAPLPEALREGALSVGGSEGEPAPVAVTPSVTAPLTLPKKAAVKEGGAEPVSVWDAGCDSAIGEAMGERLAPRLSALLPLPRHEAESSPTPLVVVVALKDGGVLHEAVALLAALIDGRLLPV